MNSDDNIREADEYYMDTLIPSYNNNNTYKTPSPNRRERRELEKIQRKQRKPKTYEPPLLGSNINSVTSRRLAEDNDIIQQSILEYEENQMKQTMEMDEQSILQESLLNFEEMQRRFQDEMEKEIIKLSLMEYEEEKKKKDREDLLNMRKTKFENTKKQMEKMAKIDKSETYYSKILEYISLYENDGLEKMEINGEEYQKFLKIIKQIRLPEEEKMELMKYVVEK
jgi:hypothetical protein